MRKSKFHFILKPLSVSGLILGLAFGSFGTRARGASETFLGNEFDSVRAESFAPGTFIIPNEDNFALFDEVLNRSSDVIIAVGTFRALEAASRGPFRYLLMTDIDAAVVAFNLKQIEALKVSSNALDFIVALLGQPPSVADQARLNSETFQSGEYQFQILLNQITNANPSIRDDPTYNYIKKIVGWSHPSRGHRASFLRDHRRYKKLHEMAVAGRLLSIHLNLADEAFGRLGTRLRKLGLKVGILDASNAPNYIFDPAWFHLDQSKLFVDGLSKLPFTTHARINVTSASSITWGSFDYYSFPADEYIKSVSSILTDGSRHQGLLRSIEGKRRQLPASTTCPNAYL